MNLNMENISRRKFCQFLLATLGMLAGLPGKSQAADSPQLIRKTIPGTAEQLPVIGLGSSRTLEVGGGERELEAFAEIFRAFFAQGGSLIDSSPMYGSAERVIGELLHRVGGYDRLFAATKVWTDGEQNGVRQMEESLRLWGIQRFDLIQIHNLRDWRTQLKTLQGWKEAGKVRYIGITTSHGRYHRELEDLLRNYPFDFVQFSYNIDNRDVEERLLPLAAERGIAVLINRPYQRGTLFSKVRGKPLPEWASEFDCASWGQFFLKFIISHPAVTCAIPATSKLRHLQDNMGAGFGRLPDASQRRRMIAYFYGEKFF